MSNTSEAQVDPMSLHAHPCTLCGGRGPHLPSPGSHAYTTQPTLALIATGKRRRGANLRK